MGINREAARSKSFRAVPIHLILARFASTHALTVAPDVLHIHTCAEISTASSVRNNGRANFGVPHKNVDR
jgi:hypothetical protein